MYRETRISPEFNKSTLGGLCNRKRKLIPVVILLGIACGLLKLAAEKQKVLDQDRIIAFTYLTDNPKKLHSLTFLAPSSPTEWKYWRNRGVIPAVGQTWYDLLESPVEKAVDLLVNLDYGGNPEPVVCIDEFGFDFGGETDQKSARIIKETKRKKPELTLTVWQMRGPVPHVLAEAYREHVSLVLLECYVGDKKDYWWIQTQVHAARMHGLLEKSVVALGLSTGKNPDETWASTKKELEQQIRFVRFIAPESPGLGFFAPDVTPELLGYADELCDRFSEIPSNGSGLPQDVIEMHKTFSMPHKQPTLVSSPLWVEPNRSGPDPNILVQPKTMRVYIMNLGEEDAKNVKIRLRNEREKGGDIFAEGVISVIPKRNEAIAVLPWTKETTGWKTWELIIEAEGCEVFIFSH